MVVIPSELRVPLEGLQDVIGIAIGAAQPLTETGTHPKALRLFAEAALDAMEDARLRLASILARGDRGGGP